MPDETIIKLGVFVLVLLGTAFHEMGHAFTAFWLGDPTPGRHGRITADPLAHLQPRFTAIILPAMTWFFGNSLFMLASTPIDPSRFRKPLRDGALMAIAGPLMNIALAAVLVGLVWIPGIARTSDGDVTLAASILPQAALWNFILAVFNMIPVPGLDGYRVVRGALPLTVRRAGDDLMRTSFCMIIALVVGSAVFRHFGGPLVGMYLAVLPKWLVPFLLG